MGKVDRRHFIVGASATGLALALPELAPGAGDGVAVEDGYVGRLEKVLGASEAAVTLDPGKPAQRIRVASGANLVQGLVGNVSDLSAFVPGEVVAFHATATGQDVWEVDLLQSVFRETTTRVTEDTGDNADEVQTESGSFARAPVSRPSGRRIPRDTSVGVSFWTDPRSGRRYAAAIEPR
jgi:hypothetical protein